MRFHGWFLGAAVLVLTAAAVAQERSKEDLEREKRFQERAAAADTARAPGWHHATVIGANLTQVSFKDWAQGGENALAYTTFLNGNSTLLMEKTEWSNSYKLAFGQTRLGSQGLRKTDDEIYFETLLIYRMGLYINPYAAATVRTQFATGYTYDNAGNRTPVSKFFDPGYLTQSVGVAYQPIAEVKTRLGVAVREIFTSEFNAYADDPKTPEIEKTKVDGGFESVTEAAWTFAENMALTSRVELFAPVKNMDRIFFRNDNMITARVNKYVNASLGAQIVNDVTISPRTQIKEFIAIGFSYTLL